MTVNSKFMLRMGLKGRYPVWATVKQVQRCWYICIVVLQLILKGRNRNETEKRDREQVQVGRQVNRLLRKERRKPN